MANDIHITDLGDPRHTPAALAALEEATGKSADLSIDATMSAAVETTGLEDFGATDFVERLKLELNEVDRHPRNTDWGRLDCFDHAVSRLVVRLNMIDYLKVHPDIREVQIVRPIFIVGMPRSGTTDLLNVMGADSRLRTLPSWEARQPIPLSSPGSGDRELRRAAALERFAARNEFLPFRELMHPTNPDFIEDFTTFESYDFGLKWGPTIGPASREMLHWRRDLPKWQAITHKDPRYTWTKVGSQLLQWLRPGERYFGKTIWPIDPLDPLLEQYPDATIVFTHRDPVAAVQSLATMFAYRARMYYVQLKPPRWYFDFYKSLVDQMVRAHLESRDRVPAQQRVDVFFEDLRNDQMMVLEKIYSVAGFPLTSNARREIEEQRSSRSRGFVPVQQGRIVYDLQSDFGVDPMHVHDEFGYYFDQMPVVAEVH